MTFDDQPQTNICKQTQFEFFPLNASLKLDDAIKMCSGFRGILPHVENKSIEASILNSWNESITSKYRY